jgi:hypothetical protein
MWISRHYNSEDIGNLNFDMKVAAYEDQIRGWFHDQARILEKASDHGAFVILLVALAYIEQHAMFLRGEDSDKHSAEFFRCGLEDIHPLRTGDPKIDEDKDIMDSLSYTLYRQLRCGLFHTGLTREKVVLSWEFKVPISVHGDRQKLIAVRGSDAESKRLREQALGRIEVNPHLLLDAIERNLTRYVARLHDPKQKQLRQNFQRAWKARTTGRWPKKK